MKISYEFDLKCKDANGATRDDLDRVIRVSVDLMLAALELPACSGEVVRLVLEHAERPEGSEIVARALAEVTDVTEHSDCHFLRSLVVESDSRPLAHLEPQPKVES